MRRTLAAVAIAAGAAAAVAEEATRFPAVLRGHAVLPAATRAPAPEDAPEALRTAGKFLSPGARPRRAPSPEAPLPIAGQPVQGVSALLALAGGRFLALSDNGFGARINSADALLALHRLAVDFESGSVTVEETRFLSDPHALYPGPIAMEAEPARRLTGADLDPESLAPLGERLLAVGDEFGPFLAVVDRETGALIDLHETRVDGRALRSPDHPAHRAPDPAAARGAMRGRRSGGFEGLGRSPDGARLYAMLEKPLWRPDAGEIERVGGAAALRILEVGADSQRWTGRYWLYPLADAANAIGDLTMIDETRGLVIERDHGQGHPERACAEGGTGACFRRPAAFKRVYMIDMAGVAPGEPVRKVGYVDLMDIADPDGLARRGGRPDGRFAFPFVTIESIVRIDATHVVLANDNNFPFSRGRRPDAPDDTEFILLEVADFLNARAERAP